MKLSALSFGLLAVNTMGGSASEQQLRSPSSHRGSSPGSLFHRILQLLSGKNIRDCSTEDPCGECQGDCDTDDDCSGDLVCYQRDATEDPQTAGIPGCDGLSFSRTDWCVAPTGDGPQDDPVGLPEPPVVEGFEPGMATEIAGLWVGEEKYNDGEMVYDYCSRALFQPSDHGNYLTWHGFYLGNSTETCEAMGVDPVTGSVNNSDYFTDMYNPEESYILSVDYKSCLTEVECAYDVTTSEGYEDYEIMATSCGAHLKEDLTNAYFSCEVYQVNRLRKKDGTGEPVDVVILTYTSYEEGYANYTCPDKPTYDLEEFMDDPVAEGTARFVLQSAYGAGTNVSEWECLMEQ